MYFDTSSCVLFDKLTCLFGYMHFDYARQVQFAPFYFAILVILIHLGHSLRYMDENKHKSKLPGIKTNYILSLNYYIQTFHIH